MHDPHPTPELQALVAGLREELQGQAGTLAVLAVNVADTNFLVDVLAALIDPRVRY